MIGYVCVEIIVEKKDFIYFIKDLFFISFYKLVTRIQRVRFELLLVIVSTKLFRRTWKD